MSEKNDRPSPIRPTDAEGRAMGQDLVAGASHGVLGVLDPETGFPVTSRIAVVRAEDGVPVTLISDLSHHTGALRADPRCSLLLGEPGRKGDPLTHPRLTLQARARFLTRDQEGFAEMRDLYLQQYPKAKLYIDFLDFSFCRMEVVAAHLNGGFGKAYVMTPEDLGMPPAP